MAETGPKPRQGLLFNAGAGTTGAPAQPPPLLREQILAWQSRIASHQASLFRQDPASSEQGSLFASPTRCLDPHDAARRLDPLALQAQSLAFWRWPSAPQSGAAIYLVLDRPAHIPEPLVLYVGETGQADRRWKGDHDCKSYLAAYSEALSRAGLSAQLAIRFWCDVPLDRKSTRLNSSHSSVSRMPSSA